MGRTDAPGKKREEGGEWPPIPLGHANEPSDGSNVTLRTPPSLAMVGRQLARCMPSLGCSPLHNNCAMTQPVQQMRDAAESSGAGTREGGFVYYPPITMAPGFGGFPPPPSVLALTHTSTPGGDPAEIISP